MEDIAMNSIITLYVKLADTTNGLQDTRSPLDPQNFQLLLQHFIEYFPGDRIGGSLFPFLQLHDFFSVLGILSDSLPSLCVYPKENFVVESLCVDCGLGWKAIVCFKVCGAIEIPLFDVNWKCSGYDKLKNE